MMDEGFDINAEYEKLHGPVSRKMLFDEEEYDSLRTQILAEPKSSLLKYYAGDVFFHKKIHYTNKTVMLRHLRDGIRQKPLPFDNITLTPYRVLMLERTIHSEKNAGHHLYYIKKEENGQVVSYAAGYLSAWGNGEFIVLENSFFAEELNKTGSTEHDFWKFMKYERKDGFCYEKSNRKYESASNAASWYLGEKSSVEMWVDDDGKSLVDDPAYKKIFIHSSEANPSEQLEFAFGAPMSKKKEVEPSTTQAKAKPSQHIFNLLLGECKASGYFLPEDGVFYVCAGSIVDEGLEITPKRQRFFDKSCEKTASGWKVIKEAKCINATAAARYVTGMDVDYTLWRDNNGKYLKDYYPNYFFIGGTQDSVVKKPSQSSKGNDTSDKPKIRWGAHAFYLRTPIGESDVYDAKGYYDPTSGQFTIKEGSLLSLTTKAAKFDQSAVGRLRVNVINENCTRERIGYRLKADEIFKDPIFAASVVMGKTVNGWNMWQDSKGCFLSAYAL